jgi:hypothetical protein
MTTVVKRQSGRRRAAGFALCALVLAGCGSHQNTPTGSNGAETQRIIQLNAQFNDGKTVRWSTLPIPVYTNGIARPEEVAAWTTATGGAVTFAFVSALTPNGINFDSTRLSGGDLCGQTTVEFDANGQITSTDTQVAGSIFRSSSCVQTVIHEVGHAIGFLAEDTDGGVMDIDGGNGLITPLEIAFVQALYALPPGTFVGLAELLRTPARVGRRSVILQYPARR